MFKFNKNFFKLYRYYCRELLKQWLSFLILIFYLLLFLNNFKALEKLKEISGWQKLFATFWLISLVQLFFLSIFINSAVSQLVGFPTQHFHFRFRFPKQDNIDDVKILLYTPGVDRKTIILTKFAAIATYFFAINFLLLTLPLFFYFLTFLPFLTALCFLLLNGLIFTIINFLFLVPVFFYYYENFSFLRILIFLIVTTSLSVVCWLWWEKMIEYPLIFPSLTIFSFLLGGYYFCFLSYQKKYLRKDLV